MTDVLFDRGNEHWTHGEAAEAVACWRQAADADWSGRPSAMCCLGAILEQQGDTHDTEAWYRRALDLGSAQGGTCLGRLFHSQGDLTAAEHWFKIAAEDGDFDAFYQLALLSQPTADPETLYAWAQAVFYTEEPQAES